MSEPAAAAKPELVPDDTWIEPRATTIPRPTAWPVGMAAGITLLAWGFVTSAVLLTVGIVLVGASLAGWIGELRHD